MTTPLRIGIDLDNTILCYLDLFYSLAKEHGWNESRDHGSKEGLKEEIRTGVSLEEGESRWQKLQSLAYGKEICRAKLHDGFRSFIIKMRAQGHELVVVSHKSPFSHFDPSVDLWKSAWHFLETALFFCPIEEKGLGFSKKDIFFEETRENKVNRLNGLGLTHFIDDLWEVLLNPTFSKTTQPILFGSHHDRIPSFNNWLQVENYFLYVAEIEVPEHLQSFRKMEHDGNNFLAELEFPSSKMVLKRYFQDPQDPRPRQHAEWDFLTQLWNQGLRNIPKPIQTGENYSIIQHIEGQHPDLEQHQDQAVEFLIQLDNISKSMPYEKIRPAADSRFRLSDFTRALDRRWKAVEDAGKKTDYPVLELLQECQSLRDHAEQKFHEVCERNSLDPEQELLMELRFLSPSDFGAHNCLKNNAGNLIFFDFEYAGWDDPVKLLCDFAAHVGFSLKPSSRHAIIDAFILHRKQDPDLRSRLRAVQDLVALEWVLIVLNVFIPSQLNRKGFAIPGRNKDELLVGRIKKARRLINLLKTRIENN